MIVESPAKAKTIEKILGKDFTVKSSMGHVRDLDKAKDGVDIKNKFTPKYIVSPDKEKVVKDLRDAVKKVDEVWLATDEDREGEAISWHLCKVLDLDEETTKRIVFREITEPAIKSAIQTPRNVDLNLVDAQQARRILDRLVGFELSSLLWKKVRGKLSAGRVQSVAVKIVVEREREIMAFKSTPFYKVNATFSVKGKDGRISELKAELPKRYDTEKDAKAFLDKCVDAEFKINKIDVKPLTRKPTAPFTTSTLQQEASRKLGFAVRRTMQNAQRLYEQGFITYMRTDSISLSKVATDAIEKEIKKNYGDEYHEPREYKSKKKDAQEAHEAIRPSYIDKIKVTDDVDQQRLYELIWKRTIASQMANAKLDKTTVSIGISSMPDERLTASGEVLVFDGFLRVYLAAKEEDEDEDNKTILPPLSVGEVLELKQMKGVERFTRPPARYTEANLVKKMEELGIGRPSTYAPTITRIMEPSRGYIIKEKRDGVERKYNVYTLENGKVELQVETENTGAINNRLVATDMGMLVCDFLDKHFDDIMDYKFTAGIEEKFDDIAEGKEDWRKMLDKFYDPFHKTVEDTLENAERATGERILGKDEESGRTMLVRMSKFGPVAQIGQPAELGEDEKPRYANLRVGQKLETISYEEAKELFKLPKTLGTYDDLEVIVAVGRFGPYVRFGDAYISIPKGEDPLELKFDRAKELIEEKKEQDRPIFHYKELPVTRGKGRFGPFLKYDVYFVNIPARFDPETITQPEMEELIEAKLVKEANRYIHRWDEHKASVQNARWGPIIVWGKKKIKFAKIETEDGKFRRITPEEAAELNWEDVKKLIEAEYPTAFKKKTRKKAATKKKTTAKKKPAAKKKAAPKKK